MKARRQFLNTLWAAALVALAGCASPTQRADDVRRLAPSPAAHFGKVTLVIMPVRGADASYAMAAAYQSHWRNPEVWRKPMYARLARNFAANGIELTVFDASIPGRTQIEPDTLQVRMTPQSVLSEGSHVWIRFRTEAGQRDTAFARWESRVGISWGAEITADRTAYLLLNTLNDTGLIAPPAQDGRYKLAPPEAR